MAQIAFDEEQLDLDHFNNMPRAVSDRVSYTVICRMIQPGGDLVLTGATRLILALGPTDAFDTEQHSKWTCFGPLVLEMAAQIPHHKIGQLKLARLIRHLSHAQKAMTCYVASDGFRHLTSLGDLQMNIRERCQPIFIGEPGEHAYYINLCAFVARLMAERVVTHPDYVTYCFKHAFEQAEINLSDQDWNCMAGSCAAFILYAGQVALTQVVQLPDQELFNVNDLLKPGGLYAGSAKGLERWKFWKKALEAAAENEGTATEYRVMARKAARMMNCLEECA